MTEYSWNSITCLQCSRQTSNSKAQDDISTAEKSFLCSVSDSIQYSSCWF